MRESAPRSKYLDVRADTTASWLAQMGWETTFVMAATFPHGLYPEPTCGQRNIAKSHLIPVCEFV